MDFLIMDLLLQKVLIYAIVTILCVAVVWYYLYRKRKESGITVAKIKKAQEEGLHEPVSLHPFIDVNSCIGTGACVAACPEKDIIGISNGKATVINASQCIGHGACFHACPTEAITLRIGTEKRGVELPHISKNFETNVPGIFIAGELGGMGLIRNAVEQGRQAVENIAKSARRSHTATYDLIIVGSGPAGISGSLAARKHGLNFLLLEQETLGGAVYSFPRKKIVMTSPMDLPLVGKVKLFETSKSELLDLWQAALRKNNITVKENSRVESVIPEGDIIKVTTVGGEVFSASSVLLAIGRRGTPRKLNIPGEDKEKVAYRLLEPEDLSGQYIVVVGGGDAAVESALLLAGQNHVTLSYRNEVFNRIKPKNSTAVNEAVEEGKLHVLLKSNLVSIDDESVDIMTADGVEPVKVKNDLVYVFAGGELPTQFLEKAGIKISRKFGETVLKH